MQKTLPWCGVFFCFGYMCGPTGQKPQRMLACTPGGVACKPIFPAAKAWVENNNVEGKLLVLLDRIELSTSPLPRECSTTELQQHCLRGSSLLGAPPQEWGEQKKTKINRPDVFFPYARAVPAPQWTGSQSGGPPAVSGQWVRRFPRSSRNCRFPPAGVQG